MFDAAFIAGLRAFMQHHVHSVWDFMSLIKYLQHAVAPAAWPWRPGAETPQRFVELAARDGIAAALALGREHVIPAMFRAFLARMGVNEHQAPTFHYYLRRHIHLDEDFHAPLSLRLL